jgi:hypothetical protein
MTFKVDVVFTDGHGAPAFDDIQNPPAIVAARAARWIEEAIVAEIPPNTVCSLVCALKGPEEPRLPKRQRKKLRD